MFRGHPHHDHRQDLPLSFHFPFPFLFAPLSHTHYPLNISNISNKKSHPIPPSTDREIEITQALQEKVIEYEKVILAACDVCAEVDCLLSFAEASRAYGYIRPEMTEDNVIDIKKGRWAFLFIEQFSFGLTVFVDEIFGLLVSFDFW